MRLSVVGCSGSVPGPQSPASCYLVQAAGFSLLLDLGNGALGPLQALLDVREIDAIVLSHLHPDHCLDMASLVVALGRPNAVAARPITVVADEMAPDRLANVMWPGRPASSLTPLFDFVTDASVLGPFAVRTVLVNHPVPTRAIRLEHGGASLVYSGDTGPSVELVELARGADVLLCEAAWGGSAPGRPDVHLTGAQAGQHATDAGVARLLITHVPPWESIAQAVDGASTTFDGPIEAVMAGSVYEIRGVGPAG